MADTSAVETTDPQVAVAAARAIPVYDSAQRPPPALEELIELWRYRDLVVQLVRRDIVARYKRSVLGVAWTMLNPLGTIVVMAVVFSQVFGRTRAYPVYVLSGLVAWTFFAQTTAAAMQQMVWGSQLMHRIYVPKTSFAVSTIGTGLVNLVLSLIPVLLVMLATGVTPQLPLLLLPVAILLLAAFSLGVGLLLSTLAAHFADVAEMYAVALTAWMYLTPVIYPEEIIPPLYRWWLFNLNPVYHLLKLFRQPLYYGHWPSPVRLVSAMVIALGTLAIGWIVFARKADEFAYRI